MGDDIDGNDTLDGVFTINERRARMGLDPLKQNDDAYVATSDGVWELCARFDLPRTTLLDTTRQTAPRIACPRWLHETMSRLLVLHAIPVSGQPCWESFRVEALDAEVEALAASLRAVRAAYRLGGAVAACEVLRGGGAHG